jgi:hypothetical protein
MYDDPSPHAYLEHLLLCLTYYKEVVTVRNDNNIWNR